MVLLSHVQNLVMWSDWSVALTPKLFLHCTHLYFPFWLINGIFILTFSLLYKSESVKIYWLSVKFDWFKYQKDESVKINWFYSVIFAPIDESVKRQITDSINEKLTDSVLESMFFLIRLKYFLKKDECTSIPNIIIPYIIKQIYGCTEKTVLSNQQKYFVGTYSIKFFCFTDRTFFQINQILVI